MVKLTGMTEEGGGEQNEVSAFHSHVIGIDSAYVRALEVH